jgi:uncharacterized membrane protein YphA (DoxX/SURF4 family)
MESAMRNDTTRRSDQTSGHGKKSITRHLPTAARLLLGFIFVVMGLNGFLNFLPQPSTPMPERAVAFLGALFASGYMVQLVSGTQVIVGTLLLANRFVPLALALIAPVIVNIIAIHIFLAPAAAPPAVVVLMLELYLAWAYRDAFRPMLAPRAAPASQQLELKRAPTVASRRLHDVQDAALEMDDRFDVRKTSGVRS